jgi:anti-sigma factor RsiW
LNSKRKRIAVGKNMCQDLRKEREFICDPESCDPEREATMDCTAVQEKMVAFLDGELPGPIREAVEGHISRCEACTEELRSIRKLNADLDFLPGLPVPHGFAGETVRKAVSRRRAESGLAGWWETFGGAWRFAACTAVLLGLLSGGVVSKLVLTQTAAINANDGIVSYSDSEPSLSATYGQMIFVGQD